MPISYSNPQIVCKARCDEPGCAAKFERAYRRRGWESKGNPGVFRWVLALQEAGWELDYDNRCLCPEHRKRAPL